MPAARRDPGERRITVEKIEPEPPDLVARPDRRPTYLRAVHVPPSKSGKLSRWVGVLYSSVAYEVSSFDSRPRVVAMQATAHACVAAAAADIIGEFLLMPGVGAGQVQHQLIRDLGGLQHLGTTFAAAAEAIGQRFRNRLVVETAAGVGWEQALNTQRPHIGVVIALANADSNEGHAVRLLGSSRPLRQADEAPFGDLIHPRAFTDVAMKVQFFDPWPTNRSPVRIERHHEARLQFERAGGQCLLIGRKHRRR